MPIAVTIDQGGHVLFTISIGYDQTGDRFARAAELILANNGITHLTILLADTLQRHLSMVKDNITEQEAIDNYQKLAQEWQQENKDILEKLKAKNLILMTWDDFRNLQEFQEAFSKVTALYNTDKEFKGNCVNNLAGKRAQKMKKNLPQNESRKKDAFFRAIIGYLLEECALQQMLATSEDFVFQYELYMGERNVPMEYVHKKAVGDNIRMIAAPVLLPPTKNNPAYLLPKGNDSSEGSSGDEAAAEGSSSSHAVANGVPAERRGRGQAFFQFPQLNVPYTHTPVIVSPNESALSEQRIFVDQSFNAILSMLCLLARNSSADAAMQLELLRELNDLAHRYMERKLNINGETHEGKGQRNNI